jgi:hypothetical protein
MTIVSDDPGWWPVIDSQYFRSYFAGSWRAVVRWTLNDQSNLKCGFAVASFVVVMYDWGEHDNIKGMSISYKYFQCLHSDKRYVDVMIGSAISLAIMVL